MTYEFKKEVSTTPGNSTRSKRDISCYVFRWTVLSWSSDGDENGYFMVKILATAIVEPGKARCASTARKKAIRRVRADCVDGIEQIRD